MSPLQSPPEQSVLSTASLAMYDFSAPLRAAHDHLWAALRGPMAEAGFASPDGLDRSRDYHDYWLDPGLGLAQACGFPYLKLLRGKVRLVATPIYEFALGKGKGGDRASVIVVRSSDGLGSIEELRGRRFAINDRLSNSGMNLPRALFAPLARDGRFFSEIVVTGGHLASLEAVRRNQADSASIDSVTYGLVGRHHPDMLEGLTVLALTPYGPGLPMITSLATPDDAIDALRAGLQSVVNEPAYAGIRDNLGLSGFAVLDDGDYLALADLERQAIDQAYPEIA